jgi:hypothetical protein
VTALPTHTYIHTYIRMNDHVYTQAEVESIVALQFEKDVLKHQMADLREKLNKSQSELEDLKSAIENMVPRCVCVCSIYVCMYVCEMEALKSVMENIVSRCVCVCSIYI